MAVFAWHRQGRLCESLASTLDAGLPPHAALGLAADAAGGAPGRRARSAADAVLRSTPLSTALRNAGEEPLICAVIAAGEASGRLPPLLRQLAAAFALRARLRDEAIGRLIYPAVLIHVALFIPALPGVVLGTAPAWHLLVGPGILWALIVALVVATRLSHRSGLLGRLALRWPLRALCRPALVADAAAVLGAALAAGLLVPGALELAADACPNRELAGRLRSAGADVRNRRLPDLTAALAQCGIAGDELELVRTGERSGKLEEGLTHCRTVAAERFTLRLTWTVKLVNGTIYGLAMLVAVIVILGQAMQYGQVIQDVQKSLE